MLAVSRGEGANGAPGERRGEGFSPLLCCSPFEPCYGHERSYPEQGGAERQRDEVTGWNPVVNAVQLGARFWCQTPAIGPVDTGRPRSRCWHQGLVFDCPVMRGAAREPGVGGDGRESRRADGARPARARALHHRRCAAPPGRRQVEWWGPRGVHPGLLLGSHLAARHGRLAREVPENDVKSEARERVSWLLIRWLRTSILKERCWD